jgi:soluble lytic murein transglycosylase-like protein
MKYNLLVFLCVILFISYKPVPLKQPISEKEFYSTYTKQPEMIAIIDDINKYYQNDLALLISLSMIESGMNQWAVNDKNINGSKDLGLYQLNNNHFRSPYILDPVINIANADAHLSYCLDKTRGDIENALRLYNGGYYLRNPNTEIYVKKVMNYYVKLKLNYSEVNR